MRTNAYWIRGTSRVLCDQAFRSAVSNGTHFKASVETQEQGCLEPIGGFNVSAGVDSHEAFWISTAKVDKVHNSDA